MLTKDSMSTFWPTPEGRVETAGFDLAAAFPSQKRDKERVIDPASLPQVGGVDYRLNFREESGCLLAILQTRLAGLPTGPKWRQYLFDVCQAFGASGAVAC